MKQTPFLPSHGAAGFTLVEVLVALAVLGGALFVLVNAHYTALHLHLMTQESVDERMLLESTVARAEMGVCQDELSGSGDFGPASAYATILIVSVLIPLFFLQRVMGKDLTTTL